MIDPQAEVLLAVDLMPSPTDWAYVAVEDVPDAGEEWVEEEYYDDPYADWTDEDWEAYWAEYEDEYYDDPYADWTDEDWEAYWAEYEDEYYDDPYADWTDEDWEAYYAEYDEEYEAYDDPYADWTEEDWDAYYADLGYEKIDHWGRNEQIVFLGGGIVTVNDLGDIYVRGDYEITALDSEEPVGDAWILRGSLHGTGITIAVNASELDEELAIALESAVVTVAANPDDEPAILACEDYPSPETLGAPTIEIEPPQASYGDLALLAALLEPREMDWEPAPPAADDEGGVEFVASEEAVDEAPAEAPAIELAEVTNEAPIEADATEAQLLAAVRG